MADNNPKNVTYSLSKRIMVDFDGQTYPIVKMLDGEGDETTDIEECKAFVAGKEGYWVAVAVEPDDLKYHEN